MKYFWNKSATVFSCFIIPNMQQAGLCHMVNEVRTSHFLQTFYFETGLVLFIVFPWKMWTSQIGK